MLGRHTDTSGGSTVRASELTDRWEGVQVLLLVALVVCYPFHAVVVIGDVPFNVSTGDAVVGLVGLLWLVGLVGTNRLPRYLVPVIGFGLVATASLVLNAVGGGAYFSAAAGVARLVKLLGGVAWLVAVYVLARGAPDRYLPVAALASVGVAVAIGGWAVYLGFVEGVVRVMWPFENPNLFGNYLLLNVCLGVYAWRNALTDRLDRSGVVVVPALGVLVLAIMATGSRGVLLGLGAVVLAVAALSESVNWRRALAGAAATAAFGFVAVLVLLQRNPYVVTRALSTKNLGSRADLWSVAADAAGSNPLLGIGYGQFPQYLPTRIPGWVTGVHNTYLLLLAEVGILGLATFLAIFAVAVRDGVELRRRYPAVAFLVAFVLGTFGQGAGTDVDNFRSLWLVLGFVAAYADRYGAVTLPLAHHVPLVEAAPAGSTSARNAVPSDGASSRSSDDASERLSANGAGDAGDRPVAGTTRTSRFDDERRAPRGRASRTERADRDERRDRDVREDRDVRRHWNRRRREEQWRSEERRGAPARQRSENDDQATDADRAPIRPAADRTSGHDGDAAHPDERRAIVDDDAVTPAVSVVVTTYNEAEYIETALDSLLAQTLSDVEIVVVDDGSTDDTVERVRAYDADAIRLIERDHLGRSAALNCGVRQANADYVAIVDPDDPSRPDRLEVQYRFLESHPTVGAVGSAYEAVDRIRGERYVRHYPTDHEEIVAAMAKYIPIAHSSMMARTDAIEAAGYYDEDADAIVDLDLLLRIGQRYRLANVDEPLIRREIRPDSSFHSMYTPLARRWRLCRLNMAAVEAYSLPWHYRVYPPLHLLYSLLPARVKRPIRRRFSAIREH